MNVSHIRSKPCRISTLNPDGIAAVRRELAEEPHVDGEILVKLRGSEVSLAADYGSAVKEKFRLPHGTMVKLAVGETQEAETLFALRQDPRVEFAEPNHLIELGGPKPQLSRKLATDATPNDLDPELWGLRNRGQTGGTPGADIKAVEAWEIGTGSWERAPLIAVLDTGIDYSHPDLAANLWKNPGEIPGDGIDNDGNGVVDDLYGYNAFDNNGDPMDGHGHGTHCAGIIAAEGGNGRGVVGVSWRANLMPVRIFDDNGRAGADAIIRGILYAGEMGAEITSNSWTSLLHNRAVEEAFASYDALHVAAAGNNNYFTDRRPVYPMGFELDNVVSVGATDHNDQRAEFSNYGVRTVDVTAPGKDILSTLPGGYGWMSGTSMATPHVTGLAGLIKDVHPGISNAEVKDRLRFSSDRVETLAEASASGGRLNAARALEHDTVAPAPGADLEVAAAGSQRMELAWTATGDDGLSEGSAVAYEVFISPQELTEENLTQAERQLLGESAPAGQRHTLTLPYSATVEGPRTYHAALRLVDNVGNRSQLTPLVFEVPAARLHFGESHGGWTAEEPWQRLEVEGREGVWGSNPPGSEYPPSQNSSLLTSEIDLSGARNTLMTYEAKYDLEPGDAVFVEVTRDGGQTWKSVRAMSRRSGDWRASEVDLSAYDGDRVQVRFRFRSNDQENSSGVLVDNFRILSD